MINEIESPFFGVSFQIEYDPSLIEISCNGYNLIDPFFGENHLAMFHNPNAGEFICDGSPLNNTDCSFLSDTTDVNGDPIIITADYLLENPTSCNSGENFCAVNPDPEHGVIYSSVTLMNGQDPVSGSGNVASCNGFAKTTGTAWIDFRPESFYFIDQHRL